MVLPSLSLNPSGFKADEILFHVPNPLFWTARKIEHHVNCFMIYIINTYTQIHMYVKFLIEHMYAIVLIK